MKLLIKFPTRNRPIKFLNVLDKYLDKLDDKTTEIIVSCDIDDESMYNKYLTNYVGGFKNVKLCYSPNKTKIEAMNADLEGVDFDILLIASDDMIPIVQGFDTIIKMKMLEHYPDTDGILWFNDGYLGDKINTLSIIGKKYYDRFGYVYNPNYYSLWCDNEFTDMGNILGKQTYFPEVIIEHQHPDWGFGQPDTVHVLNNFYYHKDKNTYYNRKRRNFVDRER